METNKKKKVIFICTHNSARSQVAEGYLRAKYHDRTAFFAQYYNNPNDPENARIHPSKFQYYDRKYLEQTDGYWYYKGKKLNVFAAIDFAFSLRKLADYTAIVIVGIDSSNNYYVLDVDRFKTNSMLFTNSRSS